LPVYAVAITGTTTRTTLDADPVPQGGYVITGEESAVALRPGQHLLANVQRFQEHAATCKMVKGAMDQRDAVLAARKRARRGK
jgi:hypothetical protein